MRRSTSFPALKKASQRHQIILVRAQRHEIDSSRAKELVKLFASAFLLRSESIAHRGLRGIDFDLLTGLGILEGYQAYIRKPFLAGIEDGHSYKIVAPASD